MRVLVDKTDCMRKKSIKLSAQELFAQNVRRIRLEKHLTQENLAEGAELHPNYISSVERAERNISIGNIEKIAIALEVSMAELLSSPIDSKSR